MEKGYRKFLFLTLYMMIFKPKGEYDILFDKISKLYEKYLESNIFKDCSKSEYQTMEIFLTNAYKENVWIIYKN